MTTDRVGDSVEAPASEIATPDPSAAPLRAEGSGRAGLGPV